MNREKGLAYCGLACCVCSENGTCAGCRNDGCEDKDRCRHFRCCKEKNLRGCWECDKFPCGGMHDKIRVRAFCQFIKRHGEEELMNSLCRNEKAGIIYHYDGQLTGDYDICESAEDVIKMLERNLTIRKMDIYDYDSVYALWSDTAGMGMRSLDDSREGITKFLNRNPDTCYVAESDLKIIGVILCGHDGRRGYIYHTAVSSGYRKQGVGKALVDAAIGALKAEGINKAALVAFKTNESGNAFWEAVGFTERDDLIYRNMSINDKNK